MYVLNLVFDLNDKNGLFCGDDTNVSPLVLGKSKNWLDLRLNGRPEPPNANRPPFDPETEVWDDLKEIGTLLIPKKYYPQTPPNQPDPDWICIRAVQHTQNQPFIADKLQFVVSFGRPVRAHQKRSSPFTDNNSPTGLAVTTFVSPDEVRIPGKGWWFPLKRIAIRPNNKKLTDRYEFSVGIIVTAGGQQFHYGEDPEMDIEM